MSDSTDERRFPDSDRPNSFVGRERDLETLREVFDATIRLVTILGPPGMGKTRLAVRFLIEHNARRRDGVFCDLRDARSSEALNAAMAGALGVILDEAESEVAFERLGHALAARGECLVVLDNFEQLVSFAPVVVARLLRVAPKARFLVTSRRALRIEGEQLHDLAPLSLPQHDQDWDSEALRLLRDRLQAQEPAFRGDGPRNRHLAEVVRRLEGIPLAIELAASQLTRVDARSLLGRLPSRVLALRSGLQNVEVRHATLRAAVDGAWELLEPWEREAFQQLTVFRGGFGLNAAMAVIDLSAHTGLHEAGDVVAALRSASFLRVVDVDHLRWDSYVVLWEFARETTDDSCNSMVEACVRHARFFLAEGKANGAALRTHGSLGVRHALLRDLDNLRAAFDWFVSQGDFESWMGAADLARVLHAILLDRRPVESVAMFTALLAWGSDEVPEDVRARLLVDRAEGYRATGELNLAEVDLTQAKSLVLSGDELHAEIGLGDGFVAFLRGELSAALGVLRTSLARAERAGDRHLQGYVHYTLAVVLSEGFQEISALKHARIAVALLRETGDVRAEVFARVRCCVAQVYYGNSDPSEELADLWPMVVQLNNPRIETIWHQALGMHFSNQRCFDRAQGEFEQALDVARRSGVKRGQGYAQAGLAITLDGQGKGQRALLAYQAASDAFRVIGDSRNRAACLGLMGGLLARKGRIDEARDILGRAETVLGEDKSYRAVLAVSEGLIALAMVKRATDDGDSTERRRFLDEAVRCFEAARTGSSRPSPAEKHPARVDLSPADRFALYVGEEHLRRALANNSVRVWSDGSAFQVGDQPVVHLPKGRLIRCLLRVLTEKRNAEPGRAMSNEDLLAYGWPGEQIRPDAAARRVHAIIYRLRKAGLEGLLMTTPDGGYLLDPSVPIEVLERAAPGPS